MIAIFIVNRTSNERSTFKFATSGDAHYAITKFATGHVGLKLINRGLNGGVVKYANDEFFFYGYEVAREDLSAAVNLEREPHPNLYPAYYELHRAIKKYSADYPTPQDFENDLADATIEKVNTILFAMENAATCDDWYTTENYWWSEILSDFMRVEELEKSEKALNLPISLFEAALKTEVELGDRIRFAELRHAQAGRVKNFEDQDYWFEEIHHRCEELEYMREHKKRGSNG